jgi:hypothetical protein
MKAPVLKPKTAIRGMGNDLKTDKQDTLEAVFGFWAIGKQAPHFYITATQRDRKGKEVAFGCLHEEITHIFPELIYLIKWHIVSWGEGPMYYIENAVYWAEKMYGVSKWKTEDYEPNPVKAFQSKVVFGAVEGDVMPVWNRLDACGYDRLEMRLITPKQAREEVRAIIEDWCKARFDRLMQAFGRDMEFAGLVKEV